MESEKHFKNTNLYGPYIIAATKIQIYVTVKNNLKPQRKIKTIIT